METKIRPGVYILDDSPDFYERPDGLIGIKSSSGGVRFEMACTRHNFFKGNERARRLAVDISTQEEPIPIKK